MFLRDGVVGEITVRVPRNILTTPIDVTLSAVDVTVAPSPSGPSAEEFIAHAADDFVSSFLQSETPEEAMELEKSIIQQPLENDEGTQSDDSSSIAESEDNLLGLGTGGINLQSIMTNIVDRLVAQLRVAIVNLSLRVVLQDMILQGTIGKAEFVTTASNNRSLKFSDIQFSLPPDMNEAYLPFKRQSVSSYESSESSTDSDLVSNSDNESPAFDLSKKYRTSRCSNPSMTDSMMFSSREARSIYQSALSPSEQGFSGSRMSTTGSQRIFSSYTPESVPPILIGESSDLVHPHLLWCDELEVTVGNSLATAEFQFGVIRSGFAHMEKVADALSHVIDGFLSKEPAEEANSYDLNGRSPVYVGLYESPESGGSTESAEKSQTRNVKIAIRRVEASLTTDLSETSESALEDQTNIVLSAVYATITQSYSNEDIQNPYFTASSPTLTSAVTIDHIWATHSDRKIMSFLANEDAAPDVSITATSTKTTIELSHQLEITASPDILENLALFSNSLSATFKSFRSRPGQIYTEPDFDEEKSDDAKCESLLLGSTQEIRLSVITSDSRVSVDLLIHPLTITKAGLRSDLLTIRFPGANISLHNLFYALHPAEKYLDPDSLDRNVAGYDLASKLSLSSLKVNSSSVDTLKSSITAISGDIAKVVNALRSATQISSARHSQPRVRFQQKQPGNAIEIESTLFAFEFPGQVGNVSMSFDRLSVARFESDCVYFITDCMRLVRHAPFDSDDNEDEFEIIGAALNERLGDRPMISASVRDMNLVNAKFYNMKIEYRVDLIAIFQSAFGIEKKEIKDPKMMRQSLFGLDRPRSPTWDYDVLDRNDGEKSEIDDEDYADEDFGLPSTSELDASIATLKSAGAPYRFDVNIRDCAIGLNPLNLPSKGLLVLTEGQSDGYSRDLGAGMYCNVKVRRATLFLIDDVQNLRSSSSRSRQFGRRRVQVVEHMTPYTNLGYVNVASMSSASASIKIAHGDVPNSDSRNTIEMEVRDDLLFIESCADSTQTLLELINGLKNPVVVPPDEEKYQTEIAPIDIMASLDDDAFRAAVKVTKDTAQESFWSNPETVTGHASEPLSESNSSVGSVRGPPTEMERQLRDAVTADLKFVESYYGVSSHHTTGTSSVEDLLADDTCRKHSVSSLSEDEHDRISPSVVSSTSDLLGDEPLEVMTDVPLPKSPLIVGMDHRTVSQKDTVDIINEEVRDAVKKIEILEDHFGGNRSLMHTTMLNGFNALITIKVKDVHVLWNLHDGYDWPHTRESIAKAVKKVESRALNAIRTRIQGGGYDDEENESIIGDFLFNSIYIGVPSGNDPRELTNAINREIDDDSETASQASLSTGYSSRPASRGGSRSSTPAEKSKLRLKRSKSHKLQIELKGVNVEFHAYPETCVVENSIDLKVRDLEIFDNVPTSTWRKFATYMIAAGERGKGGSMAHLELLNVRPDPALPISESVIKV